MDEMVSRVERRWILDDFQKKANELQNTWMQHSLNIRSRTSAVLDEMDGEWGDCRSLARQILDSGSRKDRVEAWRLLRLIRREIVLNLLLRLEENG